MTTPSTRLRETKLHVPSPPALTVHREDLLGLLSKSIRERQVTLVEAPAGSGKTTTLASWIAREEPNIAWLTLDERDDRVERFVEHLVAAIGRLSGSPVRTDERLLDDEGVAEIFREALGSLESLEAPSVLVLDDYHFVQSVDVHELVTELVEAAPATLRLVIASRTAPPLPLARWRVRRQLGEIQNESLRFLSQEASRLVQDVSGRELSMQSIETLTLRTEGWVAGLQLAALSIRASEDPDRFIDDFSGDHRHVLDFLLDEVWSTLDEGSQEQLTRLSIVDRFCSGLCDVLGDGHGGRQFLDRLDRSNLFLVPLDSRREWFRFHRLFADFLKSQLDRTGLDQQELHQRVADWFEDHGDRDSELQHRHRARDWQRFTEAVVAGQRQVWTYPPGDWFCDAVLEVPDEVALENRSFLELLPPYLISVGDIPRALQKLQLLDDATRGDEASARAPLNAMRAFLLAVRGDHDDTATSLAQAALEFASESADTARSRATLALAITALNGGAPLDAERLLSGEATPERRNNSYFTFLGALVRRAQAALALGRLELTQERLGELELERRRRGRVPIVPMHLMRCQARLLRGETTECEPELRKAFALAEEGRVQWVHEAHLLSAKLHRSRGDLDMARRALLEAAALATQSGSDRRRREARALDAEVSLQQGQDSGFDNWQQEVLASGYSSNPVVEERERFALARILLESGQPSLGSETVEPALLRARSQGRTISIIEGLCLVALAQRETAPQDAAEKVSEALALAANERIDLLSLGLPGTLDPLLRDADVHLAPAHSERSAEATRAPTRSLGLGEPLSERELEVLEELIAGRTNEQIATNLFVSKNTVKTHLKNVYAKLQVHNRGQAVAQATALGLGNTSPR